MAIDHDIDMIMTAHIIFPQVDNRTILSEKTGQYEKRPATLSDRFLKDILRKEMGYNGVVITDSMEMEGMSKFFNEDQAALEALKAGADIICIPVSAVHHDGTVDDKDEYLRRLDEVISYIENAVNNDELSEERLNEAVKRVLTLKKKNGRQISS